MRQMKTFKVQYFKVIDVESIFFSRGIQTLKYWNTCIEQNGDYAENTFVAPVCSINK